jgi:hypothetical protein
LSEKLATFRVHALMLRGYLEKKRAANQLKSLISDLP